MFGSPTGTFIRPPGSPVIVGDFRVTATFAEHIADGRGPGIDVGNGKCGDPILAMADGKVSFSDLIGTAKVVRIAHAGGYETGYAHLATIETKKGLTVKRGQRIGTLGTTGAVACHLHLGCKLNGVEIDGWPLLDQNITQEADLDPSFAPKPNTTVVVYKGARHRTSPSITEAGNIAIASDPGAPLGFPLMGTVVGQAVNGNAIWYAYWRPETTRVYYIHSSTAGQESPWEKTVGHTDQELADAANLAASVAANATATAAAAKAATYGTKKV